MVDTSLNVTATNDNRSVYEGDSIQLSCTTSHNWKTCSWLYDGKLCQFEYAYNESNVGNAWTYDKIKCDSSFVDNEFIKPLKDYDLENKNKACTIELKNVTYEGEYKCKFQRCNAEDNNYCKTKVPAGSPMFEASINVEVKLPNQA